MQRRSSLQAAQRDRLRFWIRRGGLSLTVLLVWLGASLCVAPLLIVVFDSFSGGSGGPFHRPAILGYLFVLQSPGLWSAFKNTAIEEVIILATTLFFCPLAGYAFAKYRFRGKTFLFGLMVLTLFFSPITELIPLLLEMNALNWLDTYQALVMPLLISSLGIFWMTMTIRGVPDEILDAARLDGCNSFSVWWRIVMPAIRPSLLALGFFTFITAYNDYVWPLLVVPDSSMQTVQLYLQGGSLDGGGGSPAALVVTALPTVIAFLILQRWFLPGLFKQRDSVVAEGDEEFVVRPGTTPAPDSAGIALGSATGDLHPVDAAWNDSGRAAGAVPSVTSRTGHLLRCLLICAVTLIMYINVLPTGSRLDDVYRVQENPAIHHLMPIWRFFTDPSTSAGITPDAQFRPLLPFSLALNYALGGNSVVAYHLGNIFLTMVVAVLIYFLVRELLGQWSAWRPAPQRVDFVAMVVAMLVTVHPVAGLLVSYIAGRDLLMMEALLAGALLVYARLRRTCYGPLRGSVLRRLAQRWYGPSWRGWVPPLVLFELALLAKAQAIVLPALILAFEITLGREKLSSLAPHARTLPFALVAIGHFLYIDRVLHFTALPDAPNISFDAVWTYPLTQLGLSVSHYLANFVWPFGMRLVPVEPTRYSLQDLSVVIGAIVLVGTLLGAWWLRRTDPLLAFCLLAYWIAQSPESSLVPMVQNAVDYRPYPAGLFLFLAVALVVHRRLKPAPAAAVLLLLTVWYAAISVHLNGTW